MNLSKVGQHARDAWLIVGSTLLIICLIEAGLTLTFAIKDTLGNSRSAVIDERVGADAFQDSSFASEYFEEFRSSNTVRWEPYTYWRRALYRGKLINIDSNGIRRSTLGAPIEPHSSPLKIYMFGGSTLWGTGTRDAFTIPSLVMHELRERGLTAEVTNFGESGYVSTQEVITLIRELQKGQIPDMVIFYDGVNDMYSAYQQQRAGLPQNEYNRVREFNLSQPEHADKRRALVLRDLATSLASYRLAKGLAEKLTTAKADPSGSENGAANNSVLVEQLLAVYQGNMEVVRALGGHYKFKYLFYWQPSIFEKTDLTAYERRQRALMQSFAEFNRAANDVVRQAGLADRPELGFHNLSRIFADTDGPIFLDWCHLGEVGNQIIARRISRDVLRQLSAE